MKITVQASTGRPYQVDCLDTWSDVTTKKGKNYSPPMRGGDDCYFWELHPPQVTLYTGCLDSSVIFKDTRWTAFSSLQASMVAKEGGSVYLDCVRYESFHHVRLGGTAPKTNRGPDALLITWGNQSCWNGHHLKAEHCRFRLNVMAFISLLIFVSLWPRQIERNHYVYNYNTPGWTKMSRGESIIYP